jgi:hypothetical protein
MKVMKVVTFWGWDGMKMDNTAANYIELPAV